MRHTYQAVQWVPYPVATVFSFFANPENLPRLMPRRQQARIEQFSLVAPPPAPGASPPATQPASTAAGAGTQMIISFRLLPFLPLRMKWKAAIVEFEWNHHFCDEQPQGPFAYWRHCHRVHEETQGAIPGTKVIDDLVYELPLGMLSEPAHWLLIRRQIEGVFAYRQRQLLKLLRADSVAITRQTSLD